MVTTDSRSRPGHLPTLLAAFLHFDVSFMLWVLVGSLGIFIAESLHLSAAQKGLLVAVPILSGSLLRIPLGIASDRFGARRVGLGSLGFLFLPLVLGWHWGTSLPMMLGIGLLLGTAGASFAVALPLASRWYPAERQGLVMGIAAAGNSGTVLANLVAPRLAGIVGWHQVIALAMVPLFCVLVAFALLAKDAPTSEARARRGGPLVGGDLLSYCLLYAVTFGGYVGLSGFLPIFLRDQYAVSPTMAGSLTALAAVVGSGARPLGGWIADRLGGRRVLGVLLAGISIAYTSVGALPALATGAAIIVTGMAFLGMGNGAVFQLVPQTFRRNLGTATGIIGAVGGLGGFVVPLLLGVVKQETGSFSLGFAALGVLAACAAVGIGAPDTVPTAAARATDAVTSGGLPRSERAA